MTPGQVESFVLATEARFEYLYDVWGEEGVRIQTSGGKDSTIIMEIAARIAARRGYRVIAEYSDFELTDYLTREYLCRVNERDDVDLRWYCQPLMVALAFGFAYQAYDPAAREDWVFPPPPFARDDAPWIRPDWSIHDFSKWEKLHPELIKVVGVRADESFDRRLMAGAGWKNPRKDAAWLSKRKAQPIIDWSDHAVWAAIKHYGWDWSRHYLRMWMTGQNRRAIRVGPIIGAESSREAPFFRRAYPETWARICRRFPEAMFVARYAHTALAGRGKARSTLVPEGAITESLRRLGHMGPGTKRALQNAIRKIYRVRGRIEDASGFLKMAQRGVGEKASRTNNLRAKVDMDGMLAGRFEQPTGINPRRLLWARRAQREGTTQWRTKERAREQREASQAAD